MNTIMSRGTSRWMKNTRPLKSVAHSLASSRAATQGPPHRPNYSCIFALGEGGGGYKTERGVHTVFFFLFFPAYAVADVGWRDGFETAPIEKRRRRLVKCAGRMEPAPPRDRRLRWRR